jgi:hypothetical protein
MPTATYNKFNVFTLDLLNGVHDFDAHVFKVMLTLTAPVATNTIRGNLTEIAGGNGYTTGGNTTTISTSAVSGTTSKVTASDVTFTAAGGAIANFRYAVLYNDTPTSPVDPLIAWFDYGTTVTLNDGEQLVVDFTDLLTIA